MSCRRSQEEQPLLRPPGRFRSTNGKTRLNLIWYGKSYGDTILLIRGDEGFTRFLEVELVSRGEGESYGFSDQQPHAHEQRSTGEEILSLAANLACLHALGLRGDPYKRDSFT